MIRNGVDLDLWRHTLSWPRDGLSTVGDSGDLVDLEPDSTITSPSGHAAGGLGQVNIDDL